MQGLSEEALLLTLVAVAIILLIGRGMAEVARRLGQPEVLGELLGGVLLGPSALGALFPHLYAELDLSAVIKVLDMPLRSDGSHQIPELTP